MHLGMNFGNPVLHLRVAQQGCTYGMHSISGEQMLAGFSNMLWAHRQKKMKVDPITRSC